MAKCLDDAEFWLPPQFLTDEDFFIDRNTLKPAGDGGLALGGVGWGHGSGLSSPVDSLLGSLEAESDEEDLMAELSRKMANSTLDDGFNSASAAADSKVRLLSGSPQSTLNPRWDLLREAAEEVARARLAEQLYGLSRSRGGGEAVYGAPGRPSPVPFPVKNQLSSDGGVNYSHHQDSLSYRLLLANQIQQLKQQQQHLMMKQQQQQRSGATWGVNPKANTAPYHSAPTKPDPATVGGTRRPVAAPAASAWPSVQHQNGAGMRAVFLGPPPSSKRECAGTGVFLPRRAGSQPEPRKKPACSTVLLPEKVIRALNLNLETVGSHTHLQHRNNGFLASENDCVWNLRRNGVTAHQPNRPGRSQPAPMNHEIRLPQEWTY